MFGGDHKVKRLEQIPMLADCSSMELRTVASTGDMIAVGSGDVIRHKGSSDRSFFVLLEGDAAVNGGERRLARGETYGALGLLTGTTEIDEVRMLTDGRVLIFSPRQFGGLVRRAPGFALGLARAIASGAL